MASPLLLLLVLVSHLAVRVEIAAGAPIQPDFRTCRKYHIPNFVPFADGWDGDVDCCNIPPLRNTDSEGRPLGYKEWAQYLKENPLPEQVRVRPAAHLIGNNRTYLDQLNLGFRLIKELPPSDPRSNYMLNSYHCMLGGAILPQRGFPDQEYSVHQNWLFHPFHRWFTFFYERTMGKMLGDENFALPFWNWDNQLPLHPAPNAVPPFFRDPENYPDLYHAVRDPLLAPGLPDKLVDLQYYDRDVQLNWSIPYAKTPEELRLRNNQHLHRLLVKDAVPKFMSHPMRAGMEFVQGRETYENNVHSVVHFHTGDPDLTYEDMGAIYTSLHDPLLFVHHANVDRIWSVWKELPGQVNFEDDPDFLDAEFFFFDENADIVRVTVRDCLNELDLKYTHQQVDHPWLQDWEEGHAFL